MQLARTLGCAWSAVAKRVGWGVGCALLWVGAASAQSVTPNTWNVIGLQSNDVTSGPNTFPIGASVCAGSTALPAGARVNFEWIDRATGNPTGSAESPYISLVSATPVPLALAANTCQDVFFNVQVARNAAAFDTKAPYRITLTNGATILAQTPAKRELYIEHLIAQNRNSILGYTFKGGSINPGGAISVDVGGVYELTLRGQTATQGYEQLEKFLTLPSDLFQVISVKSTYTANSGTDPNATSRVYADGCGWVNDYTNPNYHTNLSCTSTGKYGGKTDLTYVFKVLAAPAGNSYQSTAVLYDFSGSSYHYNADAMTAGIIFNFSQNPPPAMADLSVVKTGSTSTPGNSTFIITVTNNGPDAASNVVVHDPLPSGYSYKSGANAPTTTKGTYSTSTGDWTIASLANGESATLTMGVAVGSNSALNYNNVATVSSSTLDPVQGNNTSSLALPQASADLGVTKVLTTPNPITVGSTVVFAISASNAGPNAAANAVVSDILPSGLTYASHTCAAGWTRAGNGSAATPATCTIASFAAGPSSVIMTITATVAAPASITDASIYMNPATISSATVDPNTGNNNAAAGATPTFITVKKTADKLQYNQNEAGTYTLTVTKSGVSADLGTISVQDVLPAGVTLNGTPSGPGWTCDSASAFTCTRADGGAPIGPYPDITVNVIFTQAGSPQNLAIATATDSLNNVLSYDDTRLQVKVGSIYVVAATVDPASPLGSGAASCTPGTVTGVAPDTTSVCTAVPTTPGFRFKSWSSGACAGQTATCTLSNISTDLTSAALFEAIPSYTVTAQLSDPAAAALPTCNTAWVYAGDGDACTTGATSSGYIFTGWTLVSGSSVMCSPANTATCAIANVQSNVVLQANYAYSVTASVVGGNGSVSCSPNPAASGVNASCTAVPNAGYRVKNWTGDCAVAGANAVCSLPGVTAPKSSSVVFEPIPWNVTAVVSLAGAGTASCTAATVPNGSGDSCSVVPNPGFTFTGWTISGTAGMCNPVTSTTCAISNVTSNVTLTASFTSNSYPIAVSVDGASPPASGTASCSPASVTGVAPDDTSLCTATPQPGFRVKSWTGDCSATGTGVTCPLSGIGSAKSSTVVFESMPAPAAIPTLSEWGLMLMTALMAICGLAMVPAIRRH